MAKKCSYLKADGSSCQAYALKTGKLCYSHEPGKAEERKEASSRGGRSTANLSREVLIGELVEEVAQVEKKDIPEHEIKDLDSLQKFAEIQIQYIEDNKTYAKLSAGDRAEMRKWADFLLKLLIVKGLGAEQRIRQLEAIAQKHSGPFD